MNILLIMSMVVITMALIFYTWGVIGEARRKYLLPKDAVLFGLGLICDAVGTFMMSRISASGEKVLSEGVSQLMAVTGSIAIALMALHFVLSIVLIKKDIYRNKFHTISLTIWCFWLVSYITGPIGLMMN